MTMVIDFEFKGYEPFRAKLSRFIFGVHPAIKQVTAETALLTVEMIQQEIEQIGLVETGEYRDSWHAIQLRDGTWAAVTEHPAAWRHEYGFVGADITGRVYHDAPRPHVRPVSEKIAPIYTQAIKQKMEELWGR